MSEEQNCVFLTVKSKYWALNVTFNVNVLRHVQKSNNYHTINSCCCCCCFLWHKTAVKQLQLNYFFFLFLEIPDGCKYICYKYSTLAFYNYVLW